MVAPIDICNAAIVRVGGQMITSLTENSPTAIACNSQYDIVRRDLLRSHPWNFAIKYASLPQNTETPIFGYDYSYALPSDCLRVLETADQEEAPLYAYGGDFNGYVTLNNKVLFTSSGAIAAHEVLVFFLICTFEGVKI